MRDVTLSGVEGSVFTGTHHEWWATPVIKGVILSSQLAVEDQSKELDCSLYIRKVIAKLD